jgi:splicing factor 1
MAWRSQGITGSNNIPLGNRRKFPGDSDSPLHGDDSGYNPSQPATGLSDSGYKRGRSPVRCTIMLPYHFEASPNIDTAEEPTGDSSKRRKKRNRWGDVTDNKAAGLMGLPTAIMANMTSEQLEAYTLHLRIEEISQKLRIDDVVPADGDR